VLAHPDEEAARAVDGEVDVGLAPEDLEEGTVRSGDGFRDDPLEVARGLVVVDAEEEV
jgi:hypothetical protein